MNFTLCIFVDIFLIVSCSSSSSSSSSSSFFFFLFFRSLLRRLKITHVLNCAASKDYSSKLVDNPYAEDMIAYEEFEACDNEGYPILMHFGRARDFINEARRQRGRVLVHCEMGVNRSGALCIAYMMVEERLPLLQALRRAKLERPVILVNEGFQKQLIKFAMERDLLKK